MPRGPGPNRPARSCVGRNRIWPTAGNSRASPPATLNRFAYPQGVLDAVNLTAAAPGIQAATPPGFWTAPDGLMAGVDGAGTSTASGQATGLNYWQEKTQVSFWALWSTPLTTYMDLRKLNPSDPNYNAGYAANILPILTNAEVIAVDQDPGGQWGHPRSATPPAGKSGRSNWPTVPSWWRC